MNVFRWDSVEALIALTMKHESKMDRARPADGFGSWRTGVQHAREGCPDLAAPLTAACEIIASSAERDAHEWRDDRFIGASVSIGRYMMGMPGCVRRRETMPRDYRHVAIYMSVSSLAYFTAEDRIKRAATMMGLLARLVSEGVSVDLYAIADFGELHGSFDADKSHDGVICVPVDTRPLDLARIAGIFVSQDFAREYFLRVRAAIFGCTLFPPPRAFLEHRNAEAAAELRAALGMKPHDVLIPRPHPGDPCLSDPQAWIEAMAHQALK